MTARSFPSPWIVVEATGAFCVEDAEGGRIAWTYFDDDAGTAAMTREEAHRIAKAIAMVPEMRTIIRSLQDGLAQAEDEAPEA